MSKCTDEKQGRKLYAFELGMLTDREREEFEIHLIECEYCKNRALNFKREVAIIRDDPELRETVARLDQKETEATRQPRRKIITLALAAAAVFILLILEPWQIEFRPTQEAVAAENRLAVMYFENLVDPDDTGRLGEILTNLLITDISESRYISVVSSQRLYDVMASLGYVDSPVYGKDITSQLAEKLRVKWILTGSIVQTEPELVITSQVVEVSSGDIITSQRLTANADDDVFSMVDKMTAVLKQDLALPKAAINELDPPVAEVTTHSTEAYLHYLEGLENLQKIFISQAVENFQKALSYDSTFAMAYYYLADILNPEMISKALEYSDKAGQKEKMYINSKAALLRGDTDTAVIILEDLLKRFPEEKNALFSLAYIKSQNGFYAEAIDLFNKTIVIDPSFKRAYNLLAYTYLQAEDFDNALKTADNYIALAPDEPNPYDTKADILIARDDVDRAIPMLRKVISLKSDFINFSAAFRLGRLLIYRQQYEEANNTFQEIVIEGERFNRSLARTYMAEIPYYRGKLSEAAEILADGITADKMELATAGKYGARSYKHFIRSMIFAEQGNYETAYNEMESAIETHNLAFPKSQPAFRCMYVQLLCDGGNLEKAEEIFKDIEADYHAGIELAVSAYWYALGSLAFAKGNSEEAVEYFEKSVAAFPSYDFKMMLARAYMSTDRFERAIETYEQLLVNYDTPWRLHLGIWSVKAYYHLGLACEATGRYESARKYYSQFLDIWKDADEGIEEIEDARERLSRLENKS